jgi:DNA-directed RNA polymerase specialized sigma24 family protein
VDDGSAAAIRTNRAGAHDFERIYREDGPGVWRTMYAFTGGRRDVADDATAEAFARAIAHAATVRDPIAWIYRTAFRLATSELKREGRRSPAEPDIASEPPEVSGLIAALRETVAEPARRDRAASREPIGHPHYTENRTWRMSPSATT